MLSLRQHSQDFFVVTFLTVMFGREWMPVTLISTVFHMSLTGTLTAQDLRGPLIMQAMRAHTVSNIPQNFIIVTSLTDSSLPSVILSADPYPPKPPQPSPLQSFPSPRPQPPPYSQPPLPPSPGLVGGPPSPQVWHCQ